LKIFKIAGVAMEIRAVLLAGLASVAFVSGARAQSFCYGSSCASDSAITLNGGNAGASASATSSTIALTNNTAFDYGSVASANTFALGTSFSTSFNFQVNTSDDCVNSLPAGCSKANANGFAFVLSTAPSSNGASNSNFGIGTGTGTSVDLVFGTFANKNNAPGGSSNYVGLTEDGNTNFSQSPTTGNAYGISNCTSASTKSAAVTTAGCLANGDIWTASIKLVNNLLTVTLSDPKETGSSAVLTETFNVASYLGTGNVYLGFTSSGGAAWEQVNISNWTASSNAVPEPASIAGVGAGLMALGLLRRRKA